jgi:hypothetical protein
MLILAAWCVVKILTSIDTLISLILVLIILVTYETTKLTISRGQSVECWYYVETKVEEEQEATK